MTKSNVSLSNLQSFILVVLRISVGWLLLYEGVAKLLIPEWTSAAFLRPIPMAFLRIFSLDCRRVREY